MREDNIQTLIASTSKEMSLVDLFNTLMRKVVIFCKDAEMYLYFSIARIIVFRQVRRDKRGKNAEYGGA